MPSTSFNVARFLHESAIRVPGNCAVRYPQGHNPDGSIRYTELTFAELDRITAGTATYFKRQGIRAGTRTLLMARPGLDLILCAFALFRIAAVPVAIDPGMGLKSFLRCVQNTSPNALVGIPLAHWVRRIFFRKFSSVKTKVVVGTRAFNNAVKKLSLSNNCDTEIVHAKADELAAILFTSGSTGAPKGVCYTHGIFDAQRELVRDFYGIQPGEVDLPLLPIFALFNPALGMTTITPEMNPSKPATLNPEKIVQAIRQNQVTNSFGSPILWRKIAEYCDARGEKLPSIRRILCAGTAVPPALMALLKKVLPNAEIHSPYGATENLPVSDISAEDVLSETGTLTARGHGTCTGKILPQNRVRIIPVNDDVIETFDGIPALPPNTPGEICVCGPTTTHSYFNNTPATKLAKITDSTDGSIWHRIGDIGYIDQGNALWFLGRKAERVETEDGTLFTEACEPIFNTHPLVFRSALVGFGTRGHATPAIIVELKDKKKTLSNAERESLIQELREIAESCETTQHITTFIIHKGSFPVDVRHNAKIHRLSLKKLYEHAY